MRKHSDDRGAGFTPRGALAPLLGCRRPSAAEPNLRASKSKSILFVCLPLLAAGLLFADGGTLQLQKQSGGFIVSLFSTPVPLRAGTGDLSVMVQNAKDHAEILDARVLVHISQSVNGEIREVVMPATHAKATNKMLYAADMPFAGAGDWKVSVDVTRNGKTATISGPLRVLPKQPPILAYWPFFLAIPVIVALFVFNQRLKRKRRVESPRVLP